MLKELAEHWRRGDHKAVERLVDPGVEVDMTVRVMNPETCRGLRRAAADGRGHGRALGVHVEGGAPLHRARRRGCTRVLEVVSVGMRGRGSGVEFAEPVAHRYRFVGGLVVQMKLLTDVEQAIADFEARRPPTSL